MVRRTLALELARRPHGLLAAKVHLKHISIATTEGYAARRGGSQVRFHAEMEAEERKQNEKLSRLAAQHQEITALRTALASRANLRTLPGALKSPNERQ
jgi:hypothetical protein